MTVVRKLQAIFRTKRHKRKLDVRGRCNTVLCNQFDCALQWKQQLRKPAPLTVSIGCCHHAGRMHRAALAIQRTLRGYMHGRKLFRIRSISATKIGALARGVALRKAFRRRREAAVRIQSRWRGFRGRRRVSLMHLSALKIQRNAKIFFARVYVRHLIFARMYEMKKQRDFMLATKLRVMACEMIQRNYRRYRDYQEFLYLRKEKGDSDKRTQTLIVAMFTAAGSLRHHVHPWFRHLPPEIQDILEQLKNPLQRTISNVPVRGKLANEEIGKRGLRVAHVDNLTYKTPADNPDVASHMLLCVTRHLLSLVPAEIFPGTVKWACHAISHKAVEISRKGRLKQTVIQIGKQMPPHPGDSLATLWDDTSGCKGDIEAFMKVPDVSLPMTVLHTLSAHHRQVFLTANILIIMRQALDFPSLSTDDHLKFQGLDAAAGAQLMEILGSELDHPVPLDWPKAFGTVSGLAAQAAAMVKELQPEKASGHGNPKLARRPKSEKDDKAAQKETPKKESPTKTERKSKRLSAKESGKIADMAKTADKKAALAKTKKPAKKKVDPNTVDDLGHLAHFNRKAVARVLQQLGFYMRDQTAIVSTILASEEGVKLDNKGGGGVRTSRYISVCDRLFDIADHAKHDHCSYVLAVVMLHMVIRGLMLRLMYHRAALVVQKRYRYLKSRGTNIALRGPALTIQRFWRGLQAGLHTMKRISASALIVRNYRVICQRRRVAKLMRAVLIVQRCGRALIQRQWLQHCDDAAAFIQKFVRGLLVRVSLDKSGRDIMRKYQKQMNVLLRTKDSRSETEHLARCCALSGKVTLEMVKHRNRNIDMRRALSFNIRAKHTRQKDRADMMAKVGRVQPQRLSVFEPMASTAGNSELMAVFSPLVALEVISYGATRSRVLDLVKNSHDLMDRTLQPSADAALPEGTRWRCFRQKAGKGGTCKQVNDDGVRFCTSCQQKRAGLLHAAAVRGQAAMVARRKAKTSKSYVSNSKNFTGALCSSWSKAAFEVA